MRNLKRYSILIIAILFYSVSTYSQNEKESTLKGKKIIYVFGGWEGHFPKQSVDVFVPKLRAAGADVKVFDNLKVYTNKKIMDETDLIIQIWTMGKISEKQFEGLQSAIMSGTGFSGWHGGAGDAFRANLKYQFMVGGQFIFHPGGKIDYRINIFIVAQVISSAKKISSYSSFPRHYYISRIDMIF